MEFTSSDIRRLYGKRLFILPDAPAEPEVASVIEEKADTVSQSEPQEAVAPDTSFLTGGSAIDWKMKPDARLALILRPEEFSNKELTGQLKKAIVAAGIDTKLVGFGVLEKDSTNWDITNMPVDLAVFFENAPTEAQMFEVEEKKVFFSERLAHLAKAPEGLNTLTTILSHINTLISS